MFRSSLKFAALALLVATNAAAYTLTWKGGSGPNWSTPANWVENAAPMSGDSLRFVGEFGENTAMVNDLPADTEIASITVVKANFSLSGNRLALGGDITASSQCFIPGGTGFVFQNDVILNKFVTVTGTVKFQGAIDIHFQTLTLGAEAVAVGRLDGDGYLVLGSGNGSGCTPNFTENGGSFSGVIVPSGRWVTVNGSLPQTSIQAPPMVSTLASGYGQVGELSMPDGTVQPTGILTASNLTTRHFLVTLAGSGQTPRVVSAGPVVINGGQLILEIAPPLSSGDKITIIDNRSSGAISGTFSRVIRPNTSQSNPAPDEGAILTIDGYRLQISYVGGDGNDLVLTVLSGTKQWAGPVDGVWSQPNNWAPASVPQPDEDLVFPVVGFSEHRSTNDLTGIRSGTLKCTASRCTVEGNLLTVAGDITGGFTFHNPIRLGAAIAVTSNQVKNWAFYGYRAVDANGQTLTINDSLRIETLDGSGAINVPSGLLVIGPQPFYNGASLRNPAIESIGAPAPSALFDPTLARGSFHGTINGGDVDITGLLPGADVVSNGRVAGDGALGNITIGSAGVFAPGYQHWTDAASSFSHDIGTLHTGSVVLAGTSQFDLFGGNNNDQAVVQGSVSLGGALQLVVTGAMTTPPSSAVFIDNDGSDPVNGTFSGVPEGAVIDVSVNTFPQSTAKMRISYRGGDGNDVAVYAVGFTSLTLAQSASSTGAGQPFTLTASASAPFGGTPTGTVTFSDGGTTLGTAPLVNGVATLSTSLSTPGTHSLVATYAGEKSFLGSTSNAVSHDVRTGTPTHTSLAASQTQIVRGAAVTLTADVTSADPGSPTPTGTVTFLSDQTPIGSAPLQNGRATLTTSAFTGGQHTVVASYGGNADFAGSQSNPITITVGRATPAIGVTSSRNPSAPGTVLLDVAVSGFPLPTGSVTIAEGGAVLAQGALDGGHFRANVMFSSIGNHQLDIAYSGDENFNPAQTTFTQRIVPPGLAVTGATVMEGNSGSRLVNVNVFLTAPFQQTVTVDYAVADGTAKAGEDYEATSGRLTFLPGEMDKTITVRVFGDTMFEKDETFSVVLADPSNATLESASATVTIVNDDLQPARHRPASH